MERWGREVRQGLRRLRQAPVFAAIAVFVIVTSVAVAGSMTSLATAVLFRSVPYPDAGRLVRVSEFNQLQRIPEMPPSLPSVRVWREQASVFEAVGVVHAPINVTLETPDGVARLLGGLVSPDMFDTLGVAPALGRPPAAADHDVGTASFGVTISQEVWTRVFGQDPSIIGRAVTLNGLPWTVAAVLPPSTPLYPMSDETIDVWFPLGQAPLVLGRDVSNEPTFRAFPMIARLKAEADPGRIAEELRVIGSRLSELFPGSSQDWEWEVRPLATVVARDLRGPVTAMVTGALLLLLVAVVNVRGLFAQRARQGARWAAVSAALGASRRDLVRAATIEAWLVWIPAAMAGLVLAEAALRLRALWMPVTLPPHLVVGLEASTIAGVLIVAVLAGGFSGWLTGSWWWRQSARTVLAAGHASSDLSTSRAQQANLGVQVALAAVLTVTGLMTFSSIARLSAADVGFGAERLLTLRVDVPAELRSDDQVDQTAQAILTELRSTATTSAAALWSPHVPAEAVWHTGVRVFDRPDLQQDGQLPVVRIHQVGAGAATLLGLDFVEGRDLSSGDRQSGRRVALVSETAALEWWGDTATAVGRRIQRWNHDAWSTVVGVVRDAPLAGRQGEGSDFFRDVYFLHAQDAQRPLVFLVAVRGDEASAVPATRDAVRRAAPDLPLYAVRFMDDIVRDQEQIGRSTARLGGGFALVALVLVAVGLYALMAGVVTARALEISLRKALGASTARVLRDVTAPLARVFVLGGLAGLVVAWLALPGLMVDVLYEVGAREPAFYLMAVVIMLAPTLPCLLGPALRGASRSPAGVLRRGT